MLANETFNVCSWSLNINYLSLRFEKVLLEKHLLVHEKRPVAAVCLLLSRECEIRTVSFLYWNIPMLQW